MMTNWTRDKEYNSKSLIIGWVLMLFGIVQLVVGIISLVLIHSNPMGIIICFMGGVVGAVGLTSVLIGAIRSK